MQTSINQFFKNVKKINITPFHLVTIPTTPRFVGIYFTRLKGIIPKIIFVCE